MEQILLHHLQQLHLCHSLRIWQIQHLFKFDFKDFISIGWFTAISLIITFCIIDMFDTIGTLVGTASRAGMVDKEGNMPNMKEALVSDSVATVVGAVTGTSTVTTFVESASGVEPVDEQVLQLSQQVSCSLHASL